MCFEGKVIWELMPEQIKVYKNVICVRLIILELLEVKIVCVCNALKILCTTSSLTWTSWYHSNTEPSGLDV